MIVKSKTPQNATTPTSQAGQKQELDVAFFLRRAFKDNEMVHVINDFKFTHNKETAQIDHLIIHPYGFMLIESKSITGEVSVNSVGEWSRSFDQKWYGMPSPIKQVELQQGLFREMLFENRALIIGKVLGFRQRSFGLYCWENICVVSSNAIINRDSMSKSVSSHLVKTEFLVNKIETLMNIKGHISTLLTFDVRLLFSKKDINSISAFLLTKAEGIGVAKDKVVQEATPIVKQTFNKHLLKCKSCGENSDYSPQYGKFGPFIRCNKCQVNTSMKLPCPQCGDIHTKVIRKKNTYTLACSNCSNSVRLL
jgi:transcription elongation factor Elf1